MRPYVLCFLFSIACLTLGLWDYFDLRWVNAQGFNASPTALFPVVVGALVLLLTPLMKKPNKGLYILLLVLSFLLSLGLIKLLKEAMNRGSSMGLVRGGLLLLFSLWMIWTFWQLLRKK